MNKGFDNWLGQELPDVLCLQEIKTQPEQIDTSVFDRLGYRHYWFPAQKNGYSGVAILCRMKPDKVTYGMGMEPYDREGRIIRADFGDISILSAYFPSGTMGGERQSFKMDFLKDFLLYIEKLRQERPNLIISGDYNIAHTDIDINYPERHQQASGFLPEEREWLSGFLSKGYIDTFRMLNDTPNQYSWWSYRANAREKDLGWRIDYHIVSEPVRSIVNEASILQDVYHSDHCPVTVSIDF